VTATRARQRPTKRPIYTFRMDDKLTHLAANDTKIALKVFYAFLNDCQAALQGKRIIQEIYARKCLWVLEHLLCQCC
jgi:hypothetical protein